MSDLVRCVAVLLGLVVVPEVALAADPASLVRRAHDYRKEMSRIEASAEKVSLEDLLRRGNELAAELRPVVEQLSDEDYACVERDLRGYVVNREEVILLEPDTRFFSRLARRVGTTQDRLYFDFMLKVMPNGYWPAYVTRQTDAGGCTEFGGGTLSALYEEGHAILPKLAGYYRRQLERTIGDVARQVTEGTCACGTLSSVKKELRIFLELNPHAPEARQVRARLKDLGEGAQAVQENCVGGR